MIKSVVMPKLGQSEETVKIVRWRKQLGEAVAKGDILLEIETDKAVLEVESFYAGMLLKIVAAEGATVPVQTVVAFIGDPGEQVPDVTSPSEIRSPKSEVAGPLTRPSVTLSPGEREQSHNLGSFSRADRSPISEVGISRPPMPQSAITSPLRGERVAEGGARGPVQSGLDAMPTGVSAPPMFRISPRAAKLAKECVIDPTPITGTGPGGRIVERDVRQYLEVEGYGRLRITPTGKKLAAREGIDLLTLTAKDDGSQITVADIEQIVAERPQPMSRMRQIIAQRLTESYTRAPHFFVTVATDVTDVEALRTELKAQGTAYTITDFIVKSAALALEQFPMVNATSDGASVRQRSKIDIGLAVALEEGLVVPVIRQANVLTLAEIHKTAQELTAKARSGRLTPTEMTGSTFTISNMGMLDIENFTAIINPGESAILAVASAAGQPVVKNDEIVIRSIMKMTLSSDHRVIDGALAARFLNAIKRHLEEKSLWQRLT